MENRKLQNSSLITIMLFMCSLCCSAQKYYRLGDTAIVTNNHSKIFIPSGAMVGIKEVNMNNINYTFGVNDSNKIVYILTVDPLFLINKVHVGSKFNSLSTKDSTNYRPGWGYYVAIGENWYAAFDFKQKPTSESTVLFLFQYAFNKRNNKSLFQ